MRRRPPPRADTLARRGGQSPQAVPQAPSDASRPSWPEGTERVGATERLRKSRGRGRGHRAGRCGWAGRTREGTAWAQDGQPAYLPSSRRAGIMDASSRPGSPMLRRRGARPRRRGGLAASPPTPSEQEVSAPARAQSSAGSRGGSVRQVPCISAAPCAGGVGTGRSRGQFSWRLPVVPGAPAVLAESLAPRGPAPLLRPGRLSKRRPGSEQRGLEGTQAALLVSRV